MLVPGTLQEWQYVAATAGTALVLGGLLCLWSLALIPVLVLAAVPVGGSSADADGQSNGV